MDVFEAVDSRISCRWFLDRPVDPALVRNLIADAARAASGGNLHSWQVYALTGAALVELSAIFSGFIIAFFLARYGTIGVFSFIAGAMTIVFVVIGVFGPAVTKRRLEAIAA